MAYPVGPHRYLLARQQDGRIIARDQLWRDTALLLTPLAARDGRYELAVSGALQVHSGRLVGIAAPARASGYEIEALPNDIFRLRKLHEPQWTFAVSPIGVVPTAGFVVLDLRGGDLLLVDRFGVRPLLVVAMAASGAPAPAPKPAKGDPVLDFAEDFAP